MESIVQTVYCSSETFPKHTHYHDCHQIIFILKGRADFCINGMQMPAHAGNIVLFSRYENHSLTAVSKDYARYVLHIDFPSQIQLQASGPAPESSII